MAETAFSLPTFHNPAFLTTALTHRSALNEQLSTSKESNERMEYLGDAVLELVVSEYLYEAFPDEQEDMLTAYRSALVKTTTLADVARTLGLGELMVMSKGEEASGGRQNDSLLANTTEAVIGALYLDQGLEPVKTLLKAVLLPKMTEIQEKRLYKDPKSALQEIVQSKGLVAPEYVVIDEQGPVHDRTFTVEVKINGRSASKGIGKSKQLAQQAAAQALVEEPEKLETFLK